MISAEEFSQLYDKVNLSSFDTSFYEGVQIATIVGKSIVIEIIVAKASIDSGVPMDWHYVGGRGYIFAKGDKLELEKAIECLKCLIPSFNISYSA